MNSRWSLAGRNAAISFSLSLFLLFFSSIVEAQPTGFSDQLFVGSWNQAVGMTFDQGGRMFVWEKGGKVWVVENGVKLPNPLIDISEEVGNWRDFGLVGFALDPNFLSNGRIYLQYTVDRHHLIYFGTPQYDSNANDYFDATIGRVTRYTAEASTNFTTVDYNSRTILLGESIDTGVPSLHESHGIGALIFGTDGSLMVATGDGASYGSTDEGSAPETYYQQALDDGMITSAENIGAYRSQSLDSHNGKLLRISPFTGDGLASNPFYDSANPRSPKSRTYAYGLRNPYRLAMRPETGEHNPQEGDPGEFYIGDVGWGNREELNIVDAPGQNFGWPWWEGMTFNPGSYDDNTWEPANHERPKVDFRTGTARGIQNGTIYNVGSQQIPGQSFTGNASTGGTWYTGTDFPSTWQNTYFHADYGGDWIKNFVMDADNDLQEVRNFKEAGGPIVDVSTSPVNGAIYYIKYPGEIRKISFTGTTDNDPVARIDLIPQYGPGPLSVDFTGDQSFDPENGTLTFDWDFGDGNSSTDPNPTHIFTTGNSNPVGFTVTLTVTDPGGNTGTATEVVSLNNTPPVINSTSIDNVNTFDYVNGVTLNLTSNVTDAESSSGALTYEWVYALYHDDHNHLEPTINIPSGIVNLSPIGCDGATYWYRIIHRVTDPQGLSTEFVKDIYPDCPGVAQTITFNTIADKEVFDPPFTPNASSTSGLPVQIVVVSGPAYMNGSNVTLTGIPGEVILRALQPGDGTYAPALPVEQTFNVVIPGPSLCGLTGNIGMEKWNNIPGNSVSSIPVDTPPDETAVLSIFEIPINVDDNYGARVRGYICAPQTGNYTFWISSDDNGALYLSTNASEGNKSLIASVPGWTFSQQWDKYPEQQSVPIYLVGGNQYYIEALMKEAGGGDNLAVGWQLPSGIMERPIFGNRLILWDGGVPPDPLDQTITFQAIPDKFNTDPPFPITASATSGLPVSFAVLSGPATVSGDIVTLTGGLGQVVIEATQAGNAQWNPAPPIVQNFNVIEQMGPADQTIVFQAIPDKLNTDPPFPITATASSGLPVSFEVLSGPATVSGDIVTLTGGLGQVVVEATQAGDSQWNPAPPVVQNFNVSEPIPADQTISFQAIPDKFNTDPPFPLAASATSGLPVSFEVLSGPATVSGSTVTLTGGLGLVVVEATQAGNAQWNPAPPVNQSFNVSEEMTTGEYCPSSSSQPWVEWIANVSFSDLDNASSKCGTTCGYSDFTNLTATVNISSSYNLTLTPGLSWPGYQPDLFWRAWVDWNQDEDFNDAGELVLEANNGNQQVSGLITIPAGAMIGATRMRVSQQRDAYPGPCESFIYGEVEDYTVVVQGGGTGGSITLTCPSDLTVTTAPNQNTAVATWAPPIASTTCSNGGLILSQTAGSPSGSNFPIGITTISYQATDACANSEVCSFTVTVESGGVTCDNFTSGGTISGAETYCGTSYDTGIISNSASPSGGSGAPEYRWQYSESSSSGPWATLADNQLTYDPATISTTTWYRRQAQRENCTAWINSNVVVKVVDPNCPPSMDYCASSGSQPWQQWIGNVTFNTLDNDSGKNGYGDFTTLSTDVTTGNSYPLSVQPIYSWTHWDEHINVWIDFNQDGDFEDAGELVLNQISLAGVDGGTVPPVTASINIPGSAVTGSTRMRVSMQKEAFADPCESFIFGEVEDYSVNIVSSGTQSAPAQMLIFDANRDPQGVKLNWITDQEHKNNSFVVERAMDGTHYQALVDVDSRTDAEGVFEYVQFDEDPFPGRNFYRLKIIDSNGEYRYTQPVTLYFTPREREVLIFPNPARDMIRLSIPFYAGQGGEILIVNNMGQVVYKQFVPEIPATPMDILTNEMMNGLYTVTVKVGPWKRMSGQVVIHKGY
ncbi:MAG: HYR domain-containing protein [Saprospiraceae bacterium]|nr:HYR domain-containing protein [Saprospiraceae bacterium]